MKKIGEYTAKGQFVCPGTGGATHKIQLFDGSFETGYRVVDFQIMTGDPIFNNIEFTAKLTTRENNARTFDWAHNDQIAWAFGEDTITGFKGLVDPDNMIVEDLFIFAASSTQAVINYMIKMEKYDISDWEGALAMVRNKSQGSLE